jgi:hypothetical protein
LGGDASELATGPPLAISEIPGRVRTGRTRIGVGGDIFTPEVGMQGSEWNIAPLRTLPKGLSRSSPIRAHALAGMACSWL